jgi:pimeloyl-ACP methyl ester carboxylesterase
VVSPNQNLQNSAADVPPESAEPCPTPLSTLEVFESFERESTAWEVATPMGPVRGQTLGQGPAMYFLNGLEGTGDLFRLLAWLLREEFRCVIFDGRLDPQVAEERVREAAFVPEVRQLFAVADLHEDDAFLVYGSGFGGWAALAGLLAEQERFRGAILQAGYAQRRFKLLERLLMFLGRRSHRLWKEVPGWKSIFEQNHRRWFPPFDSPRWEMFQHIAGNRPVSQLAHKARTLREVHFADRLSEITKPILLLKSEGEGHLLRQHQEQMQNRLSNCREEFLKDTGRVPHWTHPHRVAKIIRQFAESLSETEQAAPA